MKPVKYPCTSAVREKFGPGSIAKRVYALEKWAYSHGYGYSPCSRPTKKDRLQQTEMDLKMQETPATALEF